jgi:hypothetical protein
MTALGMALVASGLTLICVSIGFAMFAGGEPSPSQDSFEERLERTEHHLDEMRRERGELSFDDESAPTERVPDDRKPRDE